LISKIHYGDQVLKPPDTIEPITLRARFSWWKTFVKRELGTRFGEGMEDGHDRQRGASFVGSAKHLVSGW
jgi:hypothetical protein